MKKVLCAITALALALACTPESNPDKGGDIQPTVVELTGIALTEHEITLEKGGNKVLEVKFTPENATNKALTWVSSNTSIVTVTDGIVVGVAPGTTEIIVKSGNFTDKCQVTVVVSAASVNLDQTEYTFNTIGNTVTLNATVLPSDATDKSVEWSSDNEDVATVDDNGRVTAKDNGKAVITVKTKDQEKTATCEVTVSQVVTSISLNKAFLTLSEGEGETLVPTINPSNAADKTIKWTSSNNSVATVDADGKVTAVSKGTATIMAEANDGSGEYATCEVLVRKKLGPLPAGAVDLGLSVYWATSNIGATKPEDYGDYYAWGEVETKENYSWSTYKWGCTGSTVPTKSSSLILTKYNTNSANGTVDNKIVLDPEDDVAHVKLGGNWRMPSDAEWTELRTKCTWTWTTQNGVKGRIVTATNGNSIFLPAAGHGDSANLYYAGSCGYYWSSSLYTADPSRAWTVDFSSSNVGRYRDDRYYGRSIRPVSE